MLVLNQISVQLDWQLLSIILPFGMVVVVVILGEILFRRRRKRFRSHEVELERPDIQAPPIQVPPNESYDEDSEEHKLERLQAELEETSKLYSSGKIGREEFSDRIHKVEDELLTLRTPSPPAEPPKIEEPKVEPPKVEPPKMRRCIHCNQEIPVDAVYCDRCGRYLGASSTS
jgi:hypothetical protein